MCNACSKVRFSAALGDSTTALFLVTTILTISTESPYSFMVMVQLMQGIYTTAAPNTCPPKMANDIHHSKTTHGVY